MQIKSYLGTQLTESAQGVLELVSGIAFVGKDMAQPSGTPDDLKRMTQAICFAAEWIKSSFGNKMSAVVALARGNPVHRLISRL